MKEIGLRFEFGFMLLERYAAGRGDMPDADALRASCDATLNAVLAARNAFVERHQDILLKALALAD